MQNWLKKTFPVPRFGDTSRRTDLTIGYALLAILVGSTTIL
jgi:hypothetical protein